MTSRTPGHIISSAILFLLFFSFTTFAQAQNYSVSGKVTDESGNPLEYATISFQDTSNPQNLTGGITDATGSFDIEVPGGTYTIKVEFISFEPKTFPNRTINSDLNLGTVKLGMAAANLNEVVVRPVYTLPISDPTCGISSGMLFLQLSNPGA